MSAAVKLPFRGWVLCLSGGMMTALAGYIISDISCDRKKQDPFLDLSSAQLVEEHARYPCTALKGMDVVIKNFYLRNTESVDTWNGRKRNWVRHPTQAMHPDEKAIINFDGGNDAARPLSRAGFFCEIRYSLRRFLALFSSDTHNVNSDLLSERAERGTCDRFTKSLPSSASPERENFSDLRSRKGRDLLDTARRIETEQTLLDLGDRQNYPLVTKRDRREDAITGEDDKFGKRDALVIPDSIASCEWPPCTQKYVGLFLEPSKFVSARTHGEDSPSGAVLDTATASSVVRRLADRATQQSLIRCVPFSNIPGTNCEADPSFLGAGYLRSMLTAFLLLPSSLPPLRVGVLGFGGGSLPLFLLHYFNGFIEHLDLVEVEPMCVRAAVQDLGFGDALRRYDFVVAGAEASEHKISVGSTTAQMHLEDAWLFLRKHQRRGRVSVERSLDAGPISPTTSTQIAVQAKLPSLPPSSLPPSLLCTPIQRPFDVLFVDLFQGSELANGVASTQFLALCRASLSSYGVVVFNLPACDPSFVRECRQLFGARNTYLVPSPSSANVVVLARGGLGNGFARTCSGSARVDMGIPTPRLSQRVLYQRAAELSQRCNLPFDLSAHYPIWWRFW